MPRQRKPARLYELNSGVYVIREAGRPQRSTGTRSRRQAESALARYIAEKDRPQGIRSPAQMSVAEALALYCENHAPTVKDPARIAYAVAALAPILGALPLASVNGGSSRYYQRTRNRAPGTMRRELSCLQSAINWCHAEGFLSSPVRVKLPPKPAPRERWLTRDEAAKLLRSAYRDQETRHLARFILVCLYTGTRKAAVLNLQFMPNTRGGWVDVERGIMYRRGVGVAETSKRQPPIPLPLALLAHLRRWERLGARYAVEFRGSRVGNIKSAWKRALDRSGIDHCTPHDLRRSAITWAMQAGMDRWEAAGYFGVGMDTLERVYAHHHPDYLKGAAAAMGRTRFCTVVQK